MTHKAISHKPKSLFHLDASLQKESINPKIQFNLFTFFLLQITFLFLLCFSHSYLQEKDYHTFYVAYSRISKRLFQHLHEDHDKTM
jgi:hypothetical protein